MIDLMTKDLDEEITGAEFTERSPQVHKQDSE